MTITSSGAGAPHSKLGIFPSFGSTLTGVAEVLYCVRPHFSQSHPLTSGSIKSAFTRASNRTLSTVGSGIGRTWHSNFALWIGRKIKGPLLVGSRRVGGKSSYFDIQWSISGSVAGKVGIVLLTRNTSSCSVIFSFPPFSTFYPFSISHRQHSQALGCIFLETWFDQPSSSAKSNAEDGEMKCRKRVG